MGRRVAVFPASAVARRPRLFHALGTAFGVTFDGADRGGCEAVAAAIFLEGEIATDLPGVPTLTVMGNAARGRAARVTFGRDSPVDPILRGRDLTDTIATGRLCDPQPGDVVITERDGQPLWVARFRNGAWRHFVLAGPDEIADGEVLADQLVPGRFLLLTAVIEFLKALDAEWTEPALRAAFIFDDPNLHMRSYGRIDFVQLAAQARRFGYHAVLATIPRDFAFASHSAVDIFRRSQDVLSMTVHGNDHVARELMVRRSDVDSIAMLAQSLARTASFERRTGLAVSRVMCAPHEVCSAETMRSLFRIGFGALAIEEVQLRAVHEDPPALLGFRPADRVLNGLTVVPRFRFDTSWEHLILAAYLRRPLFLYGHHWDLAEGYDLLSHLAERINGLGPVSWKPLSEAANQSYATRRRGGNLEVRLYGRRAAIESGAGVEHVTIRITEPPPAETMMLLVQGQPVPLRDSNEITVPAAQGIVDIETRASDFVDPARVPAPPWRPWPVLRRTAAELRDRTSVLL